MKKLILLFLLCSSYAYAQAPCPEGMVCLTPQAARAALAAGDKVKALEAEGKVKDQAIADLKTSVNDMKVQFAEMSGEATILKQQAVRDSALIELLVKMVRPKTNGIKIF